MPIGNNTHAHARERVKRCYLLWQNQSHFYRDIQIRRTKTQTNGEMIQSKMVFFEKYLQIK